MPVALDETQLTHSTKHAQTLSEISSEISLLSDRVSSISTEQCSEGLSLLSVRLHALLSYLIMLTFLILKKTESGQLHQECVLKLVELRQVLEKTKPIEVKLSYQINKLIQIASRNEGKLTQESLKDITDTAASLMFKPNLDNFVSDTTANNEKISSENIYKPPRISSVPYNVELKSKRGLSSVHKEKLTKSRLLNEISKEFSAAPEEIRANEIQHNSKDEEEYADRIAFEEENFVRMNVTKKDKALFKRLSKPRLTNDLDVENFDEIASLHSIVDQEPRRVGKQVDDAESFIGKISRGRKSLGKDEFSRDKKKLKKSKNKRLSS